MPAFPGGEKKLLAYIAKNTKYTEEMKKQKLEGTVIIQFVVEKDGSLTNFIVLRDIGGGSADEAIRVLKSMPAWQPGIHNGEAVRAYYNVPITFRR